MVLTARSGMGNGPTILLLHGFPSSPYDFRPVVDRLATTVLDGLRELRPAAAVVELAGLGHYRQLEGPGAFTRAALRLLSPD